MANPTEARAWMAAERDRLDALARRSSDEAAPDGDPAPDTKRGLGTHPGDAGTDRETQMEDEGLADDAARQRDELDAAIARIDDGSWGTCGVCGARIDDERLDARPQTVRCREHADVAG